MRRSTSHKSRITSHESQVTSHKSQVTSHDLPRGFRFAATACGLKKTGGLDLALIAADAPASAAAIFTTNRVQAAPVLLSRTHVRRAAARMRAVVVNSGNANCCTGPAGMRAAQKTAKQVARMLGCRAEEVLVCSTGVIGVPLRVAKILGTLPALCGGLSSAPRAFASLPRAIMTTDTRPKWAAATCRIGGKTVRLLGCAKGAGMIHPQMATMLAFVVTDAAIAPALLRRALCHAADRTFNCITVDGDTSTNDTLAILASGASGTVVSGRRPAPAARVGAAPSGRPRAARIASGKAAIHLRMGKGQAQGPAPTSDYERFLGALKRVCRSLALAIVADGEGAQRVVEITVRGASTARAADSIARTIANSPLVKTALAGADPNWGRILAASGRAPLAPRERFDPDRVEIRVAGIKMYARGRALPFDERSAHHKMLARYVPIVVDLSVAGRKSKNENRKLGGRRPPTTGHWSRIWTCDFTHDYVTINASYRT
ncbi:MAG: bifunctional ornithine acetyltransferase/N-acetylglutamate synthase [Candidatus Acidiferrales bacterium]